MYSTIIIRILHVRMYCIYVFNLRYLNYVLIESLSLFCCVYSHSVGNLKAYEQRFTENDIENSFVYMLVRLNELWSDVEISKLKNTCVWDSRLTEKLRDDLQSASTLKIMFDLLSKTHFCTWLEIRILRSMADVSNVPETIQMIDIFEKCVYHRKCSEVLQHFKKPYINPSHYKLVETKLNKNADHMVVADLIKYCHNLESIVKQRKSSALVYAKAGCLKLCLVIPKYWHLHVYEAVKSRYLKLRPFNIQYIQIETLPRVYVTDLTRTAEANVLLTEISSYQNCEFKNYIIS